MRGIYPYHKIIVMKQLVLLFCMTIFLAGTASAQLINPKATAKRKAEERANSRTDQGIDRGLDKIEEGLKGIFKKKDKKKKKSGDSTEEASAEEGTMSETSSESAETPAQRFKSYSKFDFIPGEKLLAYEDFSQDAVGDFPAKWNTNASGEVVSIEGAPGQWLKVPKQGLFFPDFIDDIPENATIEFDMVIDMENMSNNQSGLKVILPRKQANRLTYDHMFSSETAVRLDVHPSGSEGYFSSDATVIDETGQTVISNEMDNNLWNPGAINRISIWRQGTRVRLYLNENKIWDLPRAFMANVPYTLLFATYMWGDGVYISNIRIAAGQPDTRSALISKGRFSTTGILFDVNSDKINPASYGVLKDIAATLKANPAIQVQIVGHTDSDGEAAANQSLSERRAQAVVTILQQEFSIEAGRLKASGKGESEPVVDNNTPQNKAMNRRVEFINLSVTK